MSRVVVSPFGRVLRWDQLDGTPIIYPQRTILHQEVEKLRGGSFLCAPLFGPRPPGAPWYLPQHGPLRALSSAADLHYLSKRPRSDSGRGSWRFDFHFPAEVGKFPWSYDVEAHIFFHYGERTLQQVLRITRSPGCNNKSPMPVSFAVHPYLATLYGPFKISQGGFVQATERTDLHKSMLIMRENGPVQLENARHIIEVTATGNFDAYNLWTDGPEEYVCIEPNGGIRQAISLEPGEEVNGWCMIKYTSRK